MLKKNRSRSKPGASNLVPCGATTVAGGECTVQVRPENRGKCGAKHRAPESKFADSAHSSGMYWGAIEQAMMGDYTVQDQRMEPLPLKGQWQRSEVFDPGEVGGDDTIGRAYGVRYYDENETVCVEHVTYVLGPPGTGLHNAPKPAPENCAVWERSTTYPVDEHGELGDEISIEEEIMHLTKYSFEDLDAYAKECVSDDRRSMYNEIGVDAMAGRENTVDSNEAAREAYDREAASDPALWGIRPDFERQGDEEIQAARNYETLNGNAGGGFSGVQQTQAEREAYEREAASDPALWGI